MNVFEVVTGVDLGHSAVRLFTPANRYNTRMLYAQFEELKGYVGLGPRDVNNLRSMSNALRPYFPRVLERFYEQLLKNAGAASVFTGPEQIERHKERLLNWLAMLFEGEYDREYCRQRSEIGRTHVRVGLSQHYMFSAMEIVRQELFAAIIAAGIEDPMEKCESLQKMLSLELALMVETYKESYSDQVREVERRALGERLARAEHLAQIGQLAASLAHEIRNPLAGISGAVQVIRDGMPREDGRQPILAEILRQIERLDGTVEDLLVYARPKPPNLRRGRIEDVIERTLTLLNSEPEISRIRLERATDSALPEIDFDPDQIEQVLMNVIQNAAHASPPDQTVRVFAKKEQYGVCIVVEDRGEGMSESVMRRALEPFFTTKARGTGLGLAICNQIVTAHHGSIEIRSAPGVGTTVSIRVPFRPEPQPPGSEYVNRSSDR